MLYPQWRRIQMLLSTVRFEGFFFQPREQKFILLKIKSVYWEFCLNAKALIKVDSKRIIDANASIVKNWAITRFYVFSLVVKLLFVLWNSREDASFRLISDWNIFSIFIMLIKNNSNVVSPRDFAIVCTISIVEKNTKTLLKKSHVLGLVRDFVQPLL